jgi:predicted XRE-type DNA-binding protein
MKYIEAKTTEDLCRALGLPKDHAPRIRLRIDLVAAIRRQLERNGWTHADAAKRAGTGRTVITAVVNANLESISTDKLLDIAERLGVRVSVKVA